MNDSLFIFSLVVLILSSIFGIYFYIRLKDYKNEILKHKLMFRNFPTPKIQVNIKGIVEDCTISAAILFGYPDAQSMIGLTIFNLFPDFDFSLDTEDTDSFIEQNLVEYYEIRGIKNLLNIKIIMPLQGRYVFIIRNVTMERETNDKIDVLTVALQASHDGIALMDSDGMLIYANPALWTIYNIPYAMQKQLLGQHWTNIYSDKGRVIITDNIIPILDGQKIWSGAEWIKSVTGRKLYADVSLARTSVGYMGIVRDRTKFIEEQNSHQQAQKHLQTAQKNNAIARIIRGMVHDFNNTLSVIMVHSDLLLESKSLRDIERESLNYIIHATQKSCDMLSQVRSLIPKDNAENYSPQSYDVIKIFKNVLNVYELIDYKTNSLSVSIQIDNEKLKNIFHHLIRNGLDAVMGDCTKMFVLLEKTTPPYFSNEADNFIVRALGNDIFEMTYGSIDIKSQYIEFMVQDQGRGIDHDILPHILEPFFTTKDKGYSGLGLAMTASFIKSCKGAMRIKTKLNEGASVSIYLPIAAQTPI